MPMALSIVSQCPDAWCNVEVIAGGPLERPVVACGAGFADAPVCSATTYEWTVELALGTLEYRFLRVRDVAGDHEELTQHTGSWEVHAGRQVLSFAYVYPDASSAGGEGAPMLPDTALAAP